MEQKHLLPNIKDVYKVSTTWCAEIFDELNTVINFIEVGKSYLNATQQKLLERFSLSAVEFAHDFLLAEGNKEEIERRLAVSEHNVQNLFSNAIISDAIEEPQQKASDAPVALRLYDEVPSELRKIQSSIVAGIKDGVSEIIRDIAGEQTLPDTVGREALESLAKAVDSLQSNIEVAFRVRFSLMERLKGQYVARMAATSAEAVDNSDSLDRRITAEYFMSKVSPPERPPKVTDCLAPYLHDIAKLRSEGYSWNQVCEFLKQNGIEMHPSPVAMYFYKWNRQE